MGLKSQIILTKTEKLMKRSGESVLKFLYYTPLDLSFWGSEIVLFCCVIVFVFTGYHNVIKSKTYTIRMTRKPKNKLSEKKK